MVGKRERSGPTLLPRAKVIDKKVFLEETFWAELAETAQFHEDTFKSMERDESVSRNDLIKNWLRWAFEEYWAEKGGWPKNPAERAEKIAEHAKRLHAKEAELKAAADADQPNSKRSQSR